MPLQAVASWFRSTFTYRSASHASFTLRTSGASPADCGWISSTAAMPAGSGSLSGVTPCAEDMSRPSKLAWLAALKPFGVGWLRLSNVS